MKKLLLILLCLPMTGFGQCVPPNGCQNEKGIFTDALGNQYAGEWKDGIQHGQGTFTLASGEKYVGEWKDGIQHGQGAFTDALGNQYEGKFKGGLQEGQGTYTWNYGDKYMGEWKNGLKHGQGTFTWDDGDKYDGEWKNDKLWNGIETIYGNNKEVSGLVIIYTYENGNVTDSTRNDRNFYNKEDVIGEEIYCTIKLIDKISKYDVILQINNTPIKWRFDTGAEGFSIAKSQWENIKSKIDFVDLNIIRTTKGIGGRSTGNVMLIKDEIEIGGYLVKNVIVSISNDDFSLMGIGFLKKFSNVEWNMKETTLKLYK